MKAQQIEQMVIDHFNANYQTLLLVGDEFNRYLTGIQKAAEKLTAANGEEHPVDVVCWDKICGFYHARPSTLEPKDKTNKLLVAWPAMMESTEILQAGLPNVLKIFSPRHDIIFVLRDVDTEWGLNPDGPKIIQQIRNMIHSNMASRTFHGMSNEDDVKEGEDPKWIRGKRMIVFLTSKTDSRLRRGRFGLGFKECLCLANEAEVVSGSNTLNFVRENGLQRIYRSTRETCYQGTIVTMFMPWPEVEVDRLVAYFQTFLVPEGIEFTVNHMRIGRRKPRHIIHANLPTETFDGGMWVKPVCATTVELVPTRDDETPLIFEMGIPVCSADWDFP